MNESCIVVWVYGSSYQGWIPLYAFSVLKNCIDCDLKVFLDRDLSPAIKSVLTTNNIFDKIDIVCNCSEDMDGMSSIEKRCYRWLIPLEKI